MEEERTVHLRWAFVEQIGWIAQMFMLACALDGKGAN